MSEKAPFQISLSGIHPGEAYQNGDSGEAYSRELQAFRENLLKTCSRWPPGYDTAASPLPLLIPESHVHQINRLGNALCRAVTSIVERWWTDSTAGFPQRMPLLPHQEAILRWIEGEGKRTVPSFSTRRGAWRPDYLFDTPEGVSESTTSLPLRNPQICEINGRFLFNAFFGAAFTHEAYQKTGFETLGLKSPVDPSKIFAAFKAMFDLTKPIHLLKSSEVGLDIHLFEYYLRQRCGLKVHFITPEQLRLISGTTSESCDMLCCTLPPAANVSESKGDDMEWRFISPDGEALEQVHQVALELHQWEIEALGKEVLKALAPLCYNDLRTIYLVHDKRMLGIVLQELEFLVEKHILTVEEAETLREGIVPTFLPGSIELKELIQSTEDGIDVKNHYILKLVGSGKGDGIIFGTDISTEEWMDLLIRLSEPQIQGSNYVIQRLVRQPKFDVIIPSEDGRPIAKHYNLVGTFMMVDGEHLGIAGWRTGPGRVCAVSHGGTWVCSLVRESNAAPNAATRHMSHQNAESDRCRIGFDIPRITASGLNDTRNLSHVDAVDAALQKHGLVIVTLNFPDLDSTYLLNIVQSLQRHHSHGKPLIHSSTRGWFWDVKPTPKNVLVQHHARSETMDEFPWHTDCSYSSQPPRFFGLHVLQADRCGGGTLSVMQIDKVLQSLSKEAVKTLTQGEFRIEVPPEFENGIKSVIGPVLKLFGGDEEGFRKMKCRYRADIIQPLTERATNALEELSRALALARSDKDDNCLNLTPQMLPIGSVLLMDNGRWLHARNEVKDPERHLRRIRWDAREF